MKKPDTYSYKGWLNSDSFLKRCSAVFGYAALTLTVVSVSLYVLFIFLAGLLGLWLFSA